MRHPESLVSPGIERRQPRPRTFARARDPGTVRALRSGVVRSEHELLADRDSGSRFPQRPASWGARPRGASHDLAELHKLQREDRIEVQLGSQRSDGPGAPSHAAVSVGVFSSTATASDIADEAAIAIASGPTSATHQVGATYILPAPPPKSFIPSISLCNSARSCEAPRGPATQDAGRCGNCDPESRSANTSCSDVDRRRTPPLRRARPVRGSRARANVRGRNWRRSIHGDTSDSGWLVGRAGKNLIRM